MYVFFVVFFSKGGGQAKLEKPKKNSLYQYQCFVFCNLSMTPPGYCVVIQIDEGFGLFSGLIIQKKMTENLKPILVLVLCSVSRTRQGKSGEEDTGQMFLTPNDRTFNSARHGK